MISEPLVPPAPISAYKEGKPWTILVDHPAASVVIQGSAGWIPGALRGRHADLVFASIAGLWTQSDDYREEYFREVVEAVGPELVIPIHWDDFTVPLEDEPRPFPRLIDDFDGALGFLLERVPRIPGAEVRLLPGWRRVGLGSLR